MNNKRKHEMQAFSVRLQGLRKEKGSTQAEMAELLNCTTSNYQKIEYGQINLPSISLMKLADYFGVSTDYLLGLSEEKKRL